MEEVVAGTKGKGQQRHFVSGSGWPGRCFASGACQAIRISFEAMQSKQCLSLCFAQNPALCGKMDMEKIFNYSNTYPSGSKTRYTCCLT